MKVSKIRKMIDESFIYHYHTMWNDIIKKRREERQSLEETDEDLSDIQKLIESAEPIDSESVANEFNKLLDKFDFENIYVSEVDVDLEGNITVTFMDDEDMMDVIFTVDEEDGAIAIIDDGDDDSDYTVVFFDSMLPSISKTPYGEYVDLSNIRWMNKSFISAILSAGDIDLDDTSDYMYTSDDFMKNFKISYHSISNDELADIIGESFVYDSGEGVLNELQQRVIRGGKPVRLAVVRRKRRKLLTGKQKTALKRAARKRKMKKASITRKLKKSLKKRKRLGLKRSKLGKFRKVAGTSDRPR